ncbi:CTAG/Pcc1 family [Yarrowia lipolytica]|uniref:YALI0F21373p n=2 Tax=Yarrowia lipolytica TaxID=4952 RepID=B5RSL9_YARLI|nr:YALI0F21373p [Yarrowia lipolytica CLIB122]AOW07514.1 hypothetical protein YALI1_F28212g [Yarrowia lipolytica]KAB8286569.1 CTAG/Pcc1 family [Yarrowia lipolytica]KAE8173486.1 CTAG/Pcc1 family [Yarrowia lipolytica]KAJ8055414.1 CTAG/Pcc1 family [Yarrowia lipolytica]QNP99772.1 EKC/KEOPS complex subunit PCC1 [Yarrowia lipolytica]|eukprot:XP_002143116.1 YALI0F21373p [Yarrowia lipolytica CLIB122]
MPGKYTLDVEIPFPNDRQAQIVCTTISQDKPLKADELSHELTTKGSSLLIHFAAASNRSLRVGVNNMMDNIGTAIECLDELDLDKFGP